MSLLDIYNYMRIILTWSIVLFLTNRDMEAKLSLLHCKKSFGQPQFLCTCQLFHVRRFLFAFEFLVRMS